MIISLDEAPLLARPNETRRVCLFASAGPLA